MQSRSTKVDLISARRRQSRDIPTEICVGVNGFAAAVKAAMAGA
jgi:hypothetical protein